MKKSLTMAIILAVLLNLVPFSNPMLAVRAEAPPPPTQTVKPAYTVPQMPMMASTPVAPSPGNLMDGVETARAQHAMGFDIAFAYLTRDLKANPHENDIWFTRDPDLIWLHDAPRFEALVASSKLGRSK